MSDISLFLSAYFILDNDSIQKLSSLFKPEVISKNDFFTQENKNCDKLSFIKKGFLRVSKLHNDKDVTQWIASQGELITDLSSLIFDTQAQWNMQALTDCEVYTISKKDYQSLAQVIPDWVKAEKLFLSKCFLMMESRIFSFLSMPAEERFEKFMEHKGSLFNEIPHHYIASMLGMTPETLSRIRKKTIS